MAVSDRAYLAALEASRLQALRIAANSAQAQRAPADWAEAASEAVPQLQLTRVAEAPPAATPVPANPL